MGGGEVAETVLNLVQVLDQQITPAGRVAKQGKHIGFGLRVDTTSFGSGPDTRTLAFRWSC